MQVKNQDDQYIVYDEEAWPAAEFGHGDVEYWRDRDAVSDEVSGRGEAWVVDAAAGKFVLRPYRRGGIPGAVVSQSYLWTGLKRSRPWREFQIIDKLYSNGAPVPRPLFATITRKKLAYEASLATQFIPNRGTLAQNLLEPSAVPWEAIGAAICSVHSHGVNHADLNAHNILIGEDDRITIIDFDRATVPDKGEWQADNLARLHRSLEKLAEKDLWVRRWAELHEGYRDGRSGPCQP